VKEALLAVALLVLGFMIWRLNSAVMELRIGMDQLKIDNSIMANMLKDIQSSYKSANSKLDKLITHQNKQKKPTSLPITNLTKR